VNGSGEAEKDNHQNVKAAWKQKEKEERLNRIKEQKFKNTLITSPSFEENRLSHKKTLTIDINEKIMNIRRYSTIID
jgi:predicted secreted acid phosphatase